MACFVLPASRSTTGANHPFALQQAAATRYECIGLVIDVAVCSLLERLFRNRTERSRALRNGAMGLSSPRARLLDKRVLSQDLVEEIQ
jgi:hypothetical protein